MKIIGDEMLNSGEVNSTEFTDNSIKFNRLKLNSLSEIDLQTVPSNVILIDKETKDIYFYSDVGSWVNWDQDSIKRKRITLSDNGDQFNYVHFLNDVNRSLEVDNLLLSGLDKNASFVIDWWMFQYVGNTNGSLLYNGNPSAPNPVINKELCITTSGSIVDPTTLAVTTHVENDGYLNILYPPLKSINKVNNDLWHHCALVAKNDTIRLIIDAKINSETQFDIISSDNNVLFGKGYVNGIEAYIGKFRITKGTDLDWFDGGFDLPDNDYIVDSGTEFLMDSTSLIDTTLNYVVTVYGTPLNIYQENHYVYLKPTWLNNCIVTFNFSSLTTVYLPPGVNNGGFELENIGSEVVIKDMCSQMYNDWLHFYSNTKSAKIQFSYSNNTWIGHSEIIGKLIQQTLLDSMHSYAYYYMTFEGMIKNYGNGPVETNSTQPVLSAPSIPAINNKFDSRVINCNNGYTFTNSGIVRSFIRDTISYLMYYELSFNILFPATLSQNWSILQSSVNPTSNDYLYFRYNNASVLQLYLYGKSTYGVQLTDSNFSLNIDLFNTWLNIKLVSRLYNYSFHVFTMEVKNPKTGQLYYNSGSWAEWHTSTSYYIPNRFVAGNYFISDFNVNIIF